MDQNWCKHIGICLGSSHSNFQLHRLTTSENITKSFRGATFFDSHCRRDGWDTVDVTLAL